MFPSIDVTKKLPRFRGRKRMVLRTDCCYRCFDLSAVPARERREVLRLQVAQWTPFMPAEYNVVWVGAKAQLWCWQTGQIPGPGAAIFKRHAVVESRYYARPEEDAIELVDCRQGVEGRVWEHGVLTHSHWWPAAPDINAWTNFQRAAGVQPSVPVPDSQALPLSRSPWGRDSTLASGSSLEWEKPVWVALLLAVCAGTGWYGWQIYRANQIQTALLAQRTALVGQLEPLLTARKNALQDRQLAAMIHDLHRQPAQIVQIDQVIAAVPHPDQMEVVEWEYLPGSLGFTLSGKALDPSVLVRAFSKLPWARDVSAEPGKRRGQMRVRLTIDTSSKTAHG